MTEATDIHALAGAYALDAVDDLERAAFDRHLHRCATCAAEVAELRETTVRLAGAMAEAPPAGMRASVLAAVARTPQERSGPANRNRHGRGPARQRMWRWVAATAAAVVIAAGAGLATWTVEEHRVRDAQAQAAQSRRIADVLGAPDAVVRTARVNGGQVTVVVSRAENRGVAVLNGLPSPQAGRLYQLWLEPAGTTDMRSAGRLAAGQGGGIRLIDGVANADAFGVSVEPSPHGSPRVTASAIVGVVPLA